MVLPVGAAAPVDAGPIVLLSVGRLRGCIVGVTVEFPKTNAGAAAEAIAMLEEAAGETLAEALADCCESEQMLANLANLQIRI